MSLSSGARQVRESTLEAFFAAPTFDGPFRALAKRSCADLGPGGVWNYTSENDLDADFQIPMTSPHVGLEKPLWRHSNETNPKASKENGLDTKRATFISPL